MTKDLEIDHVDGWALTRTTTLERLARLCRWHHHVKTYCGYRLDGSPRHWQLVAPDGPPPDNEATQRDALDPGITSARPG